MERLLVAHFPGGQEVAAQPVHDTAKAVTSGVRTAGLGTQHMLFQADEAEVVLQVRPDKHSGRLQVMGQVLDAGLPSEAAGVELHGPHGEVARMTDDEGEFQFDALPKGDYSLTVGTMGYLLHIPSVALQ